MAGLVITWGLLPNPIPVHLIRTCAFFVICVGVTARRIGPAPGDGGRTPSGARTANCPVLLRTPAFKTRTSCRPVGASEATVTGKSKYADDRVPCTVT